MLEIAPTAYLEELETQQALLGNTPNSCILALNDTQLFPQQPLAFQGVVEGSVVALQPLNVGHALLKLRDGPEKDTPERN